MRKPWVNSFDPGHSFIRLDVTAMKWIEICVETDGEAAEAVSALFSEYSQSGTVLEEVWADTPPPHVIKVKAFLPAGQSAVLPRIEEAVWHLGQIYPLPALSVRWLSEADWMEAWKSDYDVQRVGRRILIKPSWQSCTADPDQIVIELDPGVAFGTGLHPSTRLCVVALEEYVQPGDHVLDVGTGSGILSIAAAKLGAGKVVALDIDNVALEIARENAARNGVQEIISLHRASVHPLSASDLSGSPVETFNARGIWNRAFDLLVMNIFANVIMQSAEAIAACLAADGLFVVSGIIEPQEHAVRQALAAAGLSVVERRVQKDWVALIGDAASSQMP
jgi:ribosomal protein L11 methyltransferase